MEHIHMHKQVKYDKALIIAKALTVLMQISLHKSQSSVQLEI